MYILFVSDVMYERDVDLSLPQQCHYIGVHALTPHHSVVYWLHPDLDDGRQCQAPRLDESIVPGFCGTPLSCLDLYYLIFYSCEMTFSTCLFAGSWIW